MEEPVFAYYILIGFFSLFQIFLTIWSFNRTRSYLIAGTTLIIPLLGLPITLYKLRGGLKDNQVGGVVTYLCVIVGIILFLWLLPEDEVPWMVIFTMEFFAGLSVVNIVNLAIETR